MKRTTKFIAVSAILCSTAFLFAFGCKKAKNTHVHFFDDEYDATCNGCSYIRVPAQRPEQKPEGFVVDESTDGLIIEGLSLKYTLSESMPAFNFNDVDLKVYLASGNVKGNLVPDENFKVTLTYGNEPVKNYANLTAEGEYTATVTLIDAAYIGGKSTNTADITAKITFEISNPITEIRLKSGNLSQYASKTDKMSASWVFESVRANGTVEIVPENKTEFSGIVTTTAGIRIATASFKGVETQVEYTVLPQPEVIKGIEVSFGDYERFVEKDETLRVTTNDIDVLVTSTNGYRYDSETSIIYGGDECGEVLLSARDEEYVLTVKVAFSYTVEDEKQNKIFEKHIYLKVSEIPEIPVIPEKADLTVDGTVIGGLPEDIDEETVLAESEKGRVTVIPADGVSITAGGCAEVEIDGNKFTSAIAVDNSDFQRFNGIQFSVEESAELTMYLSTESFATLSIENGDSAIAGSDIALSAGEPVSVKLTFDKAGVYSLVVFGNLNIYFVDVRFAS